LSVAVAGIDKYVIWYYDSQKTTEGNTVVPKYEIGQKVIIRPVNDQRLSLRESDIESYAGQIGEISDYYWISPRTGKFFYIYTVRVGTDYKEVVLHEDEMEACIA
jgi:hypothetical protein